MFTLLSTLQGICQSVKWIVDGIEEIVEGINEENK